MISLRTYFDPVLERGIDSAGLSFNWREQRESEEKRNEFARQASRQFTEELERATGGNYYCSPTYQSPEGECGNIFQQKHVERRLMQKPARS